jgi:hypothetical protein
MILIDFYNIFLVNFNSPQAPCKECEYLKTGVCSPSDNSTCYCSDAYTGYLCRNSASEPSLQSAESTNWTVIVAVISAVAGLLLIAALAMIFYYVITKCRRQRHSKAR